MGIYDNALKKNKLCNSNTVTNKKKIKKIKRNNQSNFQTNGKMMLKILTNKMILS